MLLADSTPSRQCLHCALPLAASQESFCCIGCQAVYYLLHEQKLTRFYELRKGRGVPVQTASSLQHEPLWLEQLEQSIVSQGELRRIELDVQGLHCSGCIWLFQQIFQRFEGAEHIVVNPALGHCELITRPSFKFREWLSHMQQFGYVFGPSQGRTSRGADRLLLRLGVCMALAGNAMLLALAMYFGLKDGVVHRVFMWASFGLSALAVVVGGSVFIASAFRALRRGVLHFDLPIALGILLAFAGSTYVLWLGRSEGIYYDTLTIFIALMVLGRWLQERALQRNRAQLLKDEAVEQLWARRVRGGNVELVRNASIQQGDQLLLALGDLVPVNAELLDEHASCSLDWINGESEPRLFRQGDAISAGAFSLGTHSVRVRASTDFTQSPLRSLLGALSRHEVPSRFWQWLAASYTLTVLITATAVFVAWLLGSNDLVRAIEVTTAVLVVTCPCAFGIATPLAYELAHTGLRRRGLFVCKADFLERAKEVTSVVFDKTGTLTTGKLHIRNPQCLAELSSHDRHVLYNMAVRSSHPKSLALVQALVPYAITFDEAFTVQEWPGLGLELQAAGHVYRLGNPRWITPDASSEEGDMAFAVDNNIRFQIQAEETLRPDAVLEIAKLANLGYQVSILSGDRHMRVQQLAAQVGVLEDRVWAEHDPKQKAEWISAHAPEKTLMLGDGVNDSLAVAQALCSGTPALDRPFMAARTDFYLATAGIAPVTLALTVAHRLAKVVRVNLALAVIYNIGAVALSAAGWMSPWLAAIAMPSSSLVLIGGTLGAFSPRSSVWKS